MDAKIYLSFLGKNYTNHSSQLENIKYNDLSQCHIMLSFIANRVIKLTQMLMVKYTQTRPHNYFDLQTPLFCPSDLAESMSS